MECTSNNSAKFQQDHEYDNGSCGEGDDDDDDVEQKNKATTSGSNPREEEEEIQINKTGNVITTVQTSSSPTMTMIVKGKRTKRQRLHSPSIPSDVPIGDKNQEEDMANCLILLAQGQSRPSSSPPPFIRRNQQLGLSSGRFSYENKRSYRSSIAGVYECKTCSRTFSSFQALGGHRASHKKLKITTAGKHLTINLGSDSPPASSSSPLSLQLGNINYKRAQSHNNKSINKVHECSVCGAEFSSGQALGGHMRRHRGTAIPLNSSTTTTTTTTDNPVANTTLSLSTAIAGESATATAKVDRINTSNNGLLSLDLNLPLPASPSPEDHDETKFSFASKQPQSQQQQQSAMLFSTPALVDCFF